MSDRGASRDSARDILRLLVAIAEDFLDAESQLPSRAAQAEELVDRLGIRLGQSGASLEQTAQALREVMRNTPSSSSPRFFNQLFGGREPIATVAEMLVPLADTSMYTYKVAGAQVLVEREVLSKLLAAVPFPEGEGAFSPGGSLANLTAMVIARNRAAVTARDDGLSGSRLTAYTSEEAHYSVPKAAGILGIGRNNVRSIPVDGAGSMRSRLLARAIAADRAAGRVPFFVNATVGTTVRGAIDPIDQIARITGESGAWLHVDGALGASLLLSSRYRHRLSGAEMADSLAWNAHKMIGVPLACSVLLLREKGLLARNLGESAGYLFQADEDALNPGTRSLQCGRRSDALKLWALWKRLGDAGMDARMTRSLDLAMTAAGMIEDDNELRLMGEPRTVCVCFQVAGVDSASLCDLLDKTGTMKIGYGSLGGETALRLVCVDPDLDENRLASALRAIKEAARELRA